MITLADLLMERFKVRTRAIVNPKRASVGTTALEIFDNNPNRLAWVIINTHATQVLYVALERSLAAARAVRIDAAGGKASMVWDEDFQMTGWAIWGLGSAADTTFYAIEVVSY